MGFAVQFLTDGALLIADQFQMKLQPVTDTIIRCIYSREEIKEQESMLREKREAQTVNFDSLETDSHVILKTSRVTVSADKKSGILTWKDSSTGAVLLQEGQKEFALTDVKKYTTDGEEPIIDRVKTVDGERNFIKNLREYIDHQAYRGKLHFEFKAEEGIYGLGQAEEGIYNYRHHNQYLYQHNMRIPMPMFVSSEGYGMFFDTCSLMTFEDDHNGSYLFFDTIPYLDYYMVCGTDMDEIVAGFRYLTGDAAMLPKWAYGYIQSKEQYYTAKELADVVREYRTREVPLDCVVQDWNTWEPGNWGEKCLDPARYGDLREQMDQIHDMHAHAMVSVWPNMNTGGKNHTEFLNAGFLLNDLSTYNAFSKEAREMYFNQAKKELFDGGFDSWWCDSTEPFSGPDWGGEIKREPWERFELVGQEHKKFLEPELANGFALMHAKGMFENQRKATEDIRVLNLTRSGYASGQKYGAMLWSGDISASWQTMKDQIAEGLNMGLSGYPYWTLDIGGFFTVGEKWQNRGCSCSGDPTPKWFWKAAYDEGVKDRGYKELYVRWLQFGTFLPMFRSHGTDTPREIWNFGEKGEIFYDTIEKFIKLRYRLMPYIYSLAGEVRLEQGTIMRSLMFDFAADKKVRDIGNEFMFGENILVCPVTEPMYFEAGNIELEDTDKTWSCYLPAGTQWIDYWSGERFEGGQTIKADAPLSKMPLFIKAGSILPMQEGLQYADEEANAPLQIHVYSGADADFTLYEDEGNNYNYEKGAYATTKIHWSEKEQKLTVEPRVGSFHGMKNTFDYEVYVDGRKI
ncbi:MAG: TIM-barrel domain-containing protein [Lachnospiraceae bacterium]